MGCSKSSSKREVYRNTILPQEIRKISNKQPYTLSNKRKKKKQKPKLVEGKEIIQIREEINEIEMKKTVEKINETKSWFLKR